MYNDDEWLSDEDYLFYGNDTWYEDDEDDDDYYDDVEDDRYQVIDADRHTLVFDPVNHTYGETPIIEQYLKWTNFSRAARWLILLIARLDRAVLKLCAGLLKARSAHDDIPF